MANAACQKYPRAARLAAPAVPQSPIKVSKLGDACVRATNSPIHLDIFFGKEWGNRLTASSLFVDEARTYLCVDGYILLHVDHTC